jgi:hypothetical protein
LITPCMSGGRSLIRCGSAAADLSDLASTDAAGAHVETLWGAVNHGANALNVWTPTTLGAHMGVRH